MTTPHPYRLLLRTTAPEASGGVLALDESPARPVTHITGPCGGGKTVLAQLLAEAFTAQVPDGHVVWLSVKGPTGGPNLATDRSRVTVLRGPRDPRTDGAITDPHTTLGLAPTARVLTILDEVALGLIPSYRGDPQYVALRGTLEAAVAAQQVAVDHAGPGAPAPLGVPGPRVRLVLTSQHPLSEDLYGPVLMAATGTRVLAGRCTSTAWAAFAGPYRDAVPAWAADQMGHQRGGYWVRPEAGEPVWFPCRVPVDDAARWGVAA